MSDYKRCDVCGEFGRVTDWDADSIPCEPEGWHGYYELRDPFEIVPDLCGVCIHLYDDDIRACFRANKARGEA